MHSTERPEGPSATSRAAEPARGIRPPIAWAALLGTATFLLLLAALHGIKPGLDPSWHVISEYAIGSFGWVMVVAFSALALGCVALFLVIKSEARGIAGRIGLALLLLAAAGLTLAAIFPTDPITASSDDVTASGRLHSLGASLGAAIPLAALFIGWSLRRNPAWASARRSLFWAAVLAWAGLLTFSVSMAVMLPQSGGGLGPDVLIGWPNRFMMLAYSGWLITVSWQAARRPSKVPGTHPVASRASGRRHRRGDRRDALDES